MNTYKVSILVLAVVILTLAGCSSPTPVVTQTPSAPTPPPAVATQAPTATTAPVKIAPTATVTATLVVSITIGTPIVPAGQATAGATSGTNPLDNILNAEQALISRPVRVTTVTTGTPVGGTSVVEFVPPDRVHFKQGGMEVISIKSQGTWFKLGSSWQPIGFDVASTVFSQFDPASIKNLQSNIIVGKTQLIGQDTLNGRPMTVYSFTATVTAIPGNYTSTSKMWVGASDGLPYQIISDSPNPLNPSSTIHAVSTYDYDPNIKISAPV